MKDAGEEARVTGEEKRREEGKRLGETGEV